MPRVKFTWAPGMNARKCNREAAYTDTVDFVLRREALKLQSQAKFKLSAHTDTGDSEITLSHGKLDYYVNLDDSRGQGAAWAIEFGHIAEDGRFVEGIHALTGSLP